jgi:hypothetical protein
LSVQNRNKFPPSLNQDVVKGVMIDDFGLTTNKYYAILDGIVVPPRSDKTVVAVRMMFPIAALVDLRRALTSSIKQYEKRFDVKLEEEKNIDEIAI